MATRSVVALVLLLLLSACVRSSSSSSGGTGPPPATAAPAVVSRYGAPPVTNERQLGDRMLSPCRLLDSTDLRRLGLDPGSERPRAADVGPSCAWYANRDKDFPSVSLGTTPGHDLFVGTYRARLLRVFVPTTLDGFPAVAEMVRPGDTSCVVTVGVNNDEGLSAWWYARESLTPATEPCTNAARALAAVIAHLPPR